MVRPAAGIIALAADTGRVLAIKRSRHVNHPHTWSIPGGGIDPGEHPTDAAIREIYEEVCPPPGFMFLNLDPADRWQCRDGAGFYYHFACVPMEFEPRLNFESEDWAWVSWDEMIRLPLHPEFRSYLRSIS